MFELPSCSSLDVAIKLDIVYIFERIVMLIILIIILLILIKQ